MTDKNKKTLAEFLRALLSAIVSLATAWTVSSCQIYQGNPDKVDTATVNVHYDD